MPNPRRAVFGTIRAFRSLRVLPLKSAQSRPMNGASPYRYPVKGLSPEKLSSVQFIEPGLPSTGDSVQVEPVFRKRRQGSRAAEPDNTNQLICTACYYLFDPRTLNGAWTAPQDLPESYRCPDCGAGRDAVAT